MDFAGLQLFSHCFLSCHFAPLKTFGSVFFTFSHYAAIRFLLLPWPSLLKVEQPRVSPFSCLPCASAPQSSWWPSMEFSPLCQCFSCNGEPKTMKCDLKCQIKEKLLASLTGITLYAAVLHWPANCWLTFSSLPTRTSQVLFCRAAS